MQFGCIHCGITCENVWHYCVFHTILHKKSVGNMFEKIIENKQRQGVALCYSQATASNSNLSSPFVSLHANSINVPIRLATGDVKSSLQSESSEVGLIVVHDFSFVCYLNT